MIGLNFMRRKRERREAEERAAAEAKEARRQKWYRDRTPMTTVELPTSYLLALASLVQLDTHWHKPNTVRGIAMHIAYENLREGYGRGMAERRAERAARETS